MDGLTADPRRLSESRLRYHLKTAMLSPTVDRLQEKEQDSCEKVWFGPSPSSRNVGMYWWIKSMITFKTNSSLSLGKQHALVFSLPWKADLLVFIFCAPCHLCHTNSPLPGPSSILLTKLKKEISFLTS